MPDDEAGARHARAAGLAARVALVLGVAVALELLFARLTALPAAAWNRPVLVLALAEPATARFLVAAAVLATGVLAVARRSLGPTWLDVEHGREFRLLIVFTALLLTWGHAGYPYNFYVGRAHGVDRILLVVLLGLVWWRPLVLVPFLLVLLTIPGQFAEPIGGFSTAAVGLPVRVLFLATAFWLVRTVTPRVRTADAMFLVCCLLAAHYWVSGWAKVRLGWVTGDRISLLLPTTYGGGWLAFLEPDTIGRITAVLAHFDPPFRAVTLGLELGALVSLADRRLFGAMLVAWIGMHGVIFAVSGILFWEWMLIEAMLLVLLFRRDAPTWSFFTRPHFALSVVLVGLGALWFRPSPLAWLDAPVNYAYRVHAMGASGRSYAFAPRDFAPYGYQFTLGDFGYLDEAPLLPIAWGAIRDRPLLDSLLAARSAEALRALEHRHGTGRFDARRAAAFDTFIRRFFAGWNARGGHRGWWRPLRPPERLWTFHRGDAPDRTDPIERVVVEQVTTWYDGRRYREIRSRPVRIIDIPAPAGIER